MGKGVFITGTDTGVGKTFVASATARALRAKGLDVGVMKPVETGCAVVRGVLAAADAVALMEASGTADPMEVVCPYRFTRALSPHLAARLEGAEIDPCHIRYTFEGLARGHDVTLVEGAGGLLVPLTESFGTADLVRVIGVPIVIVAANRLGVINHTLLTVECAFKRGIEVAAIVLNSPPSPPPTAPPAPPSPPSPTSLPDESRAHNTFELRGLTRLPVFELAYVDPPEKRKKAAQKKAPLEEGGHEETGPEKAGPGERPAGAITGLIAALGL